MHHIKESWIFSGVNKEKEGRIRKYHDSHNANPVLISSFSVSTVDDLDLLYIKHFNTYYIALKDGNMFFFKKLTCNT